VTRFRGGRHRKEPPEHRRVARRLKRDGRGRTAHGWAVAFWEKGGGLAVSTTSTLITTGAAGSLGRTAASLLAVGAGTALAMGVKAAAGGTAKGLKWAGVRESSPLTGGGDGSVAAVRLRTRGAVGDIIAGVRALESARMRAARLAAEFARLTETSGNRLIGQARAALVDALGDLETAGKQAVAAGNRADDWMSAL